MAVLQLFITPGELDQALRELAEDHGLQGCRYEGGRYSLLPAPLSLFDQEAVIPRLFLFPPEAAWDGSAEPRPRELGWVDVTPGQVVEKGVESGPRRILTLSTLQAEDRKELPVKPSAWLKKLKKNLAGRAAFGVRGTNVVHGGSHDYKDIGYSPGAVELRREGVVWKQFANDNAEFAPL